jgi:hypothetical protein
MQQLDYNNGKAVWSIIIIIIGGGGTESLGICSSP